MNARTIYCRNLKKSFYLAGREFPVLKNIEFEAFENQLIMIMGPSGSGKSTLLSILGGLLTPDSGTCLILDTLINALPEHERTAFRGKNIGFMFQKIILVPTLNALENAAIPLLIQGSARMDALERAKELLISFGLEDRLYAYPEILSGGEQQRIAIARACIHNPKIILCDEPTSFLDLERGKKIMELMQRIKIEGKRTIIIVTHDPRILPYADAIVSIDDGKISNNDLLFEAYTKLK